MVKRNVMGSLETHKEVTIPILFVIGFLILFGVAGYNDIQQAFTVSTIASVADKFFSDAFVMVGILAIFFYELIPTAFRLLGTTGFFIGLLQEGFNPFVLILIAVAGRIVGWFILYLLGRFIYRIFKGKHRTLSDAGHFLHKYRLIVFFTVPFLGALGDLVMIIAGHQRIGFIRILPFLFLSVIVRYSIWLYITIGQMNFVSGG
jgi:membrane protein YqaA with SNARE-associated domain